MNELLLGELTLLIKEWQAGDTYARNKLFEEVYDVLKEIATKKLYQRLGEVILQPTLLVNEAFIKLANQKKININDRKHFFAIAARVILEIIIDHREQQGALMRGGNLQRVSFSGIQLELVIEQDSLISFTLQQALDEFARIDERAAYLFQLKYVLGFTIQEVCQEVNLGHTCVEDDLRMAKAWLAKKLS